MILFTGDIHLNPNPRDSYRHKFMAETLPALVSKHKVDVLVILGDLTDEKDFHGAWLVNRVVRYLHELGKICLVFVLKGNHDYTDPNNPFFAFLSSVPGVHWVNTPTLNISSLDDVMLLPHTGNWKRDWKDLEFRHRRLILTHQTFQGAKVGPRELEGIPLDIFPEDARIISGDIHVPQTFDVVTYTGAPYLCNFGDDYAPRVLLWNGKGRPQSVPVPGPQKRLLEISSLGELKDCLRMVNAGDICKVRVALYAKDHAQWPQMQERVRKWGAENDLQMYTVQPKIISQKGKATARRQVDTRTDRQLVELYSEARAIGVPTRKTGLELMDKGST